MLALIALIFMSPFIMQDGELGPGLSPTEVYVEVAWSGWNVRLMADGWLGFVASEPRDDLLHVDILKDDAVVMISRLLEMGFFYMPDDYPSVTESLKIDSKGRLKRPRTIVRGGSVVRIHLRVEDSGKVLTIAKPIATAPMELVQWITDFQSLANRSLFGGG